MSKQVALTEVDSALLGKQLGMNNQKEIDVARILSQGKHGGKTLISEEQNPATFTWALRNESNTDVKIGVVASMIRVLPSFAGGQTGLVYLGKVLGADYLLKDGQLISTAPVEEPEEGESGVADAAPVVTATSLDSGRYIDELLTYALSNPTRILSASMESRLLNGSPDTGNFTTSLKTVWMSPFHKSEDSYLPLRKFQSNRSNSPQFCDVNFKAEGFPVILSSEHSVVITVKAGTELTITGSVGMQFSTAQYLYRAVGGADSVIPSFSQVGNCNC